MTAVPVDVHHHTHVQDHVHDQAPEHCPHHDPKREANAWLARHHAELHSRATACFARYAPDHREEAAAEVVALTARAVHRAAEAGTLARLTPWSCVRYARRQLSSGRRATPYTTRDVLAEYAQHHRGVRVLSIDRELGDAGRTTLGDVLPAPEHESPAEIVRRNHDLELVLRSPRVSPKAAATLRFFAETLGQGRQVELAKRLKVTPGRIVQLKDQLATVLRDHGYAPPLARRPVRAKHTQ